MYANTFNVNDVNTFYTSWLNGSLTPIASSQALPNYTDLIANSNSITGTILPIVRSNFETRCKGDTDDIIVMFINNSIDYNNTIMLYYLEAVNYYAPKAPNMHFYQINMSLNDLPEYNIDENSRLPSMKIFTYRNNKQKPYDFHDDLSNYVDSVANYKLFIEKYKFNPFIN